MASENYRKWRAAVRQLIRWPDSLRLSGYAVNGLYGLSTTKMLDKWYAAINDDHSGAMGMNRVHCAGHTR